MSMDVDGYGGILTDFDEFQFGRSWTEFKGFGLFWMILNGFACFDECGWIVLGLDGFKRIWTDYNGS